VRMLRQASGGVCFRDICLGNRLFKLLAIALHFLGGLWHGQADAMP